MTRRLPHAIAIVLLTVMTSGTASAAPAIDGATLTWPWALPFIGLLLTIATGPLLFAKIWHHHYGKLAFAWAALAVAPMAVFYGVPPAIAAVVHAVLAEYMSFIVLLFALYVVAGGILVTGIPRATPLINIAILTFGTVIASLVGTTGAAMILIRPLLRANASRLFKAHVVVFFIILVANAGGALSPLGDPPLFVGFLRGVEFFWTTQHLLLPTALIAGILLAVFVVVDAVLARRDRLTAKLVETTTAERLRLRGGINIVLIASIIGAILAAAWWRPGVTFDVYGTHLELQNLARDAALLLIAILSLVLTPSTHREENGFTFEPIREVAILFAGIFVCIIPVLAMLQAGHNGSFAWLLALVSDGAGNPNNLAYFWLTGSLSAVLDNAPTYLVFFELAGGNAQALMGPLGATLAAISMGAVYMGAMTYIGNAPNLMIYAIASESGVRMPSFFAYLGWTILILLPVLGLVAFTFVSA